MNNLEYHQVTVTPDVVHCLHNVLAVHRGRLQDQPDTPERWVAEQEAERLYRWLAYVRQSLHRTWQALPDGDHLKDAYREDVWAWNDEDLAARPASADLPGADDVPVDFPRRPRTEEVVDD